MKRFLFLAMMMALATTIALFCLVVFGATAAFAQDGSIPPPVSADQLTAPTVEGGPALQTQATPRDTVHAWSLNLSTNALMDAYGSSQDVTPIKPLGGTLSFVPTADANLGFSF